MKSAPASTTGEGIAPPPGWATTSTLTASVDHAAPSKTPKRKSSVVLEPAGSGGAVNHGVVEDPPLRTTPGPPVWIQPEVRPNPFGWELQRPSSWTRWPAKTVWSEPASACGAAPDVIGPAPGARKLTSRRGRLAGTGALSDQKPK